MTPSFCADDALMPRDCCWLSLSCMLFQISSAFLTHCLLSLLLFIFLRLRLSIASSSILIILFIPSPRCPFARFLSLPPQRPVWFPSADIFFDLRRRCAEVIPEIAVRCAGAQRDICCRCAMFFDAKHVYLFTRLITPLVAFALFCPCYLPARFR